MMQEEQQQLRAVLLGLGDTLKALNVRLDADAGRLQKSLDQLPAPTYTTPNGQSSLPFWVSCCTADPAAGSRRVERWRLDGQSGDRGAG